MTKLPRFAVLLSFAAACLIPAFAVHLPFAVRAGEAPTAENPWVFQISTVLLSIEDAKLRKAGIQWNERIEKGSLTSGGIRTALIDAKEVSPLVYKFRAHGCQVLANPQLMTIDGQEAIVHSGGELAATGDSLDETRVAAKAAYLEFGTRLTVTPTCLSPEHAFLELTLEHGVVVERGGNAATRRIPIVATQKLATAVALNSRQSLLVSVPSPSLSAGKKKAAPRSLVAIVNIEEVKRQIESKGSENDLGVLQDELKSLQREVARLSELVAKTALVSPRSGEQGNSALLPAPPAPRTVERAVAAEPVEWRPPTRARLLTKVYAVADLGVPVQDARPLPAELGRRLKASELFAEPTEPAKPEFDSLIKLITSTVEPDSWEARGGAGAVHFLEKNLSLAVTQSEAVHGKVAELLEGLRWLQDHSVELEISLVSATLVAAEEAGLDLAEKGRLLSPERAKSVRTAFAGEKDTQITTAPRVTLYNRQLCELQTDLPGDRRLHLILHGAIGEDLRTVRLNLAVNPENSADAVRSGVSTFIPSGETFVLDVTDRLAGGGETGVPLLSKVPHLNRLFKNVAPAASERTLLLITSRVRIDTEAVQP